MHSYNEAVRRPTMPPFFFFNDTATTEIYTLSLHDALPISARSVRRGYPSPPFPRPPPPLLLSPPPACRWPRLSPPAPCPRPRLSPAPPRTRTVRSSSICAHVSDRLSPTSPLSTSDPRVTTARSTSSSSERCRQTRRISVFRSTLSTKR